MTKRRWTFLVWMAGDNDLEDFARRDLARLVVAEAHRGSEVRRASGVSIYVPLSRLSVAYDRLALARRTRWGALVREVQG